MFIAIPKEELSADMFIDCYVIGNNVKYFISVQEDGETLSVISYENIFKETPVYDYGMEIPINKDDLEVILNCVTIEEFFKWLGNKYPELIL